MCPARRPPLSLVSALALAALAGGQAAPLGAQPPPAKKLVVPEPLGHESLAARSKAQFATLDQFDVFYFFRFRDRLTESGITFEHRIVDDAGKHYKAVHYDHGNGIAVADVDGDGLEDVYFTTQAGANELWRNRGGGKFENVTEAAGVALADRISVTASFADIDNDGDQDLFVTTVRMGNALFENDGKGVFTDISKAAGVDYSGHSSGAVFFDYDRDGLVDLFVANVGVYTTDERGRDGYWVGIEEAFSGHLFPARSEASILYRNLGGNKFADVSRETGLVDTSWSGDATAADVDRDGWQDLYVLNMQGDDHLWLNREGRFVEAAARHFPRTSWGAMGVEFFDFDNDGLDDLLVTDMHSDMSEEIGPDREKLKSRMQWPDEHLQGGDNNVFGNSFYRNLGDGKFEEISDRVGAENYWPWGFSVGDLNADGFEDVFIAASMNYPFRYGINTVLLNNRGERFLDSEFILGVEPREEDPPLRPWFDLDCAGADREHKHCRDEEAAVKVYGALGTRSSVIFDLDRDGDLDIVTNEFGAPPQVLLSDLAEQSEHHWVEVRLVGRESNRDGLGARVTVVAGGRSLSRVHDGKSGYLSQSALPLYFGLGEAGKIDRIEVEWPSGREQTVTEDLAVDRRLVIEEEVPADGERPS